MPSRPARAAALVTAGAAALGLLAAPPAAALVPLAAPAVVAGDAHHASFPVVRRGDDGQPVRTLQYLLRAHGRTVAVDGDFGPATERAVRSFQRSRGLAADGVVGERTWSALIVTVRRGSRGDAVRAVQDQAQFRNLSANPARASPSTGSSDRAPSASSAGSRRPTGWRWTASSDRRPGGR